MNRRVLLGLIVAWGLCMSTASMAPAALPNSIITGDTVSDAAAKTIQTYIDSQIKQLSNPSQPQAQQAAREALIRESSISDASGAFLDTYSRLLNDALLPLAKNPHMRVRLNAAIVASRVADRVGNTRLSEVTLAFIHDPSESVIFWGLQAANSIVPAILRNPLLLNDPLVESILPAAKAHPDGPVIQAAYDTLSLGILDNRDWAKTVTPDMLKVTTPMLLDLLDFRVKRYVSRLPADPQSENRATLFLADKRVWVSETQAQRLQSTRLITNLLSMLCQYTANSSGTSRERLVPVVQQTASALWVIGDFFESDKLKSAVQPLIKLGLNTKPQELLDAAGAIYQAAKTLPGLADMPQPPTTRNATSATKERSDAATKGTAK
jgi:hypothetical protein